MSALTMTLIIEQHNVMQVFKFQETPESIIIMKYFPLGNIVDAGSFDEESYVSVFGQILNGLYHLHTNKVVHCDLKPENLLVERNPFFKIIISDFDLAKFATNTTLLTTFSSSLQYAAPEVFPGFSNGHKPLVDVWLLGVIVFDWIYSTPKLPDTPQPKQNKERVSVKMWHHWIDTWTKLLLDKLDFQDDEIVIQLLSHMIEVEIRKRWYVNRCLVQVLKNGLFKRRAADGLIVCATVKDELDLPTEEGDDGLKKPTTASPHPIEPLPQSASSLVAINPEATVILGKSRSTSAAQTPRNFWIKQPVSASVYLVQLVKDLSIFSMSKPRFSTN